MNDNNNLYDLLLERALIGLLIEQPNSKNSEIILKKLTREVFFDDRNKLLFEIIQGLKNDNAPIDLFSVFDKIRKSLNKAIDSKYVIECINMIVNESNAEYHIYVLFELKFRRDMSKLGFLIEKRANDFSIDILNQLKEIQVQIDRCKKMITDLKK